MPTEKSESIASLLRSKELEVTIDRRIKVRPAGLATTLNTGDLVIVGSTSPDVVENASLVGSLIDLGKEILDRVLDEILNDNGGGGGGDSGGGDTITVTVKGAGGRKVTITID